MIRKCFENRDQARGGGVASGLRRERLRRERDVLLPNIKSLRSSIEYCNMHGKASMRSGPRAPVRASSGRAALLPSQREQRARCS
jgi:hypothetical protein